MYIVRAEGVQEAWPRVMKLFEGKKPKPSRYGETLDLEGPLMVTYTNPKLRVLTDPVRDANPVFHLMEAIWMLAGREDVGWIAEFNSKMREFSDNGMTFHGAYGYRWRHHFFIDQLTAVIDKLRCDPMTRRAVITMYDPDCDLESNSKDIPCNLSVAFNARNGPLDAVVFNRSNDCIWGMLGSNVVHFSILLEVVAVMSGLRVGQLTQVTSCPHVYTEVYRRQSPAFWGQTGIWLPFADDPDTFFQELELFVSDYPGSTYSNTCFNVAEDLRSAYREKRILPNPYYDWEFAYNAWRIRRSTS